MLLAALEPFGATRLLEMWAFEGQRLQGAELRSKPTNSWAWSSSTEPWPLLQVMGRAPKNGRNETRAGAAQGPGSCKARFVPP